MQEGSLQEWFAQEKDVMEQAYLVGETPWNQSGFGGTEERWNLLRRPVADSIDRSGAFLDIGCANGYLMECVERWTGERGLAITTYGLDLSESLVELAKTRLPQHATRLFAGNGWDWQPPQQFDIVNTDVVYVPEALQREYLARLLDLFVADGGLLLVSEYRPSREADNPRWATDRLREWGLEVTGVRSGIDISGKELTHVTVIAKK